MTAQLTCARARLLISVCADGEANDLEHAAVGRHVRSCSACLEFQALVEKLPGVQRDTWEQLPAASPETVLAAACRTQRVRRRQPLRALLVGSVTVAMVLVALGWWVRVGDGWIRRVPASQAEITASVTLVLPQVSASRVLDPSYVPYLERTYPIVSASRHDPVGTPDERKMYSETPMSRYEEEHYRPEEL